MLTQRKCRDTAVRNAQMFAEPFVDAMGEIVAGTKSAKDAFKSMAASILQEIQRIIANQLTKQLTMMLVNGFTGGVGGSASAAATPTFHTGGYTGSGGEFDAKLLGGEYVLQRSAVANLGIQTLDALNAGAQMPNMASVVVKPGATNVAPPNVKVVNVSNQRDALEEFLNTSKGEKAVMSIMEKNRR